MDTEYYNGKREREYYDSIDDMTKAAQEKAKVTGVKKLTLHFPKMIIPKKAKRGAK